MENLSFGWNITRQYDLKGALHARLSSSEAGEVLLDQNFVNDMNVSPLYVSRKSKRNLQRAVYNDTNFLNVSFTKALPNLFYDPRLTILYSSCFPVDQCDGLFAARGGGRSTT